MIDPAIKSLHHVALVVKDMAKMKAFYGDVVGLREVRDYTYKSPDSDATLGMKGCDQHIALFQAGDDESLLELMAFINPVGGGNPAGYELNEIGFRHIGFAVSDIHNLYKRMVKAGVEFVGEPITHAGGFSCVFFRDPEGNSVEFFQE